MNCMTLTWLTMSTSMASNSLPLYPNSELYHRHFGHLVSPILKMCRGVTSMHTPRILASKLVAKPSKEAVFKSAASTEIQFRKRAERTRSPPNDKSVMFSTCCAAKLRASIAVKGCATKSFLRRLGPEVEAGEIAKPGSAEVCADDKRPIVTGAEVATMSRLTLRILPEDDDEVALADAAGCVARCDVVSSRIHVSGSSSSSTWA